MNAPAPQSLNPSGCLWPLCRLVPSMCSLADKYGCLQPKGCLSCATESKGPKMEKPSAFFIARQVKNLPLPKAISKTYLTAGKRRKSMISQGYTLCEVSGRKLEGKRP